VARVSCRKQIPLKTPCPSVTATVCTANTKSTTFIGFARYSGEVDAIIQRIYHAGTVTAHDGHVRNLESSIDQREGGFLFDIIRNDPGVTRTLEVGCALGLSSLHICSALRGRPGASHVIIDPFQTAHWHGLGIKHLEDAGVDFFKLLEVKSEFALPRQLEEGEGRFDFIFVDGWHTFDHTLLDCFYATRLLHVGGYLAIDDVTLPSVGQVVAFLKAYPCYEEHGWIGHEGVQPSWKGRLAGRLGLPNSARLPVVSMVALKKIAEDVRPWDWHVNLSS
jgi:predicted O-methyltransferase YrrM